MLHSKEKTSTSNSHLQLRQYDTRLMQRYTVVPPHGMGMCTCPLIVRAGDVGRPGNAAKVPVEAGSRNRTGDAASSPGFSSAQSPETFMPMIASTWAGCVAAFVVKHIKCTLHTETISELKQLLCVGVEGTPRPTRRHNLTGTHILKQALACE